MPQSVGGWWHHRQTAKASEDLASEGASFFYKAPVNLLILGGFVFKVDGGDDGTELLPILGKS